MPNAILASDRTYGARRVWHDLLAEGYRAVAIALSD
jgi:transposase InsO family protein